MSEVKKVVLAYSGGLDTSIIIPWLKEHYNNCEVIAVCGNVGQKGELDGLEERAKASGASKLYIEDLTDEFVEDYVIPTMQAGADYEGYLLGTSFARPILAKRVVEIARAEGADAVCHGSTGKGNDQVRFELAIMHFAPDLKIITPWREWDIQSRDEEIDYAEAHHIPLKISRETNYSKDKNLWHLSHEGLDLEDPGNEPQYDKPGFLELGVSPKTAPDKSEFVELEFEQGVPVALNGEKLKPAAIIAKLNEIGGRNGIGLYDVVENRLVGMKSRGVYETPGGTILYKAHEVLETLTLDKLTAHKKRELAITFGELVYDGQWFGDRYFSYVASFGAFTRSSYATPQNVKNALGHTAYVLSGITELSQIRNEHVKMEIDGQVVEGDFLFGAICNSTSVGGILTLDPKQVDMGDGLFEILLVRAPENLGEIHECIQALQSQKYNCAMLTFRSAQKVRIFADPEMPWTLDGEKEDGHEMVEVENLHHAIRLMQKKDEDA